MSDRTPEPYWRYLGYSLQREKMREDESSVIVEVALIGGLPGRPPTCKRAVKINFVWAGHLKAPQELGESIWADYRVGSSHMPGR